MGSLETAFSYSCLVPEGHPAAQAHAGAVDCADAPDWIGTKGARGEPVDEASEATTIGSIVQGVRVLSGIRGDRVALVGHSAGARAAVRMASTGGLVEAVVSLSGAYSAKGRRQAAVTPLAAGLSSPLLIVHGTLDENRPVSEAREYEAAARANGKAVEAIYVEGLGHDGVPFAWQEEVRA